MNFESILIITYGRTGSTLLMGILNTIPGVLIRGENMNFCLGLFSAYKALKTTKNQHGNHITDSTEPFYGAENFDEKIFLKDARSLLKHQLIGNKNEDVLCWGFKEIRYLPNNLGNTNNYNLTQYLDFLSKLMPNPAFIFLTRNPEKVTNSGFWKSHKKEEVINQINLFEKEAKEWSKMKSNCFWISYEEITNQSNKLSELFHFLGTHFDKKTINKILLREHSYGGRYENISHVLERKIDDYHNIIFRLTPNTKIEFINFDTYEVKNNSVNLGGVIVLEPNISKNFKLTLKKDKEYFEMTWNIPSPIIAKKFPNNPNAKNARFKVLIPPLKEGESANVYLINTEGKKEHIATLLHKT